METKNVLYLKGTLKCLYNGDFAIVNSRKAIRVMNQCWTNDEVRHFNGLEVMITLELNKKNKKEEKE